MVVADSPYQAHDALELIDVEYELARARFEPEDDAVSRVREGSGALRRRTASAKRDGGKNARPELLAREMDRVRRRCHRLVWLNPLLGSASYEPLTRGMLAALDRVDEFLPAHNLASLEQLAAHLGHPR